MQHRVFVPPRSSHFEGVAGQSFGCPGCWGVNVRLEAMPKRLRRQSHELAAGYVLVPQLAVVKSGAQVILGNTVCYGATAALFLPSVRAGNASRFATAAPIAVVGGQW